MNEFEIGLMSYLGREKLEKLGKVKVESPGPEAWFQLCIAPGEKRF